MDPDDSTLAWVEAHLPICFPLFKCSEVLLKELAVTGLVNGTIEELLYIGLAFHYFCLSALCGFLLILIP